MDLLQRFVVSPKHAQCQHQIMNTRLFDELFENFLANYDYLIENNSNILSITTKCYKCYTPITFRYNLQTGELTTSKNKYNIDDKALQNLDTFQRFLIRVFFEINFPINDPDQDKRAMIVHAKALADEAITPAKSPRFYNICRTFSISDDGQKLVNIVEGVIRNHLEIEIDFEQFKKLYTSLNKAFNKENVTFKLAKK